MLRNWGLALVMAAALGAPLAAGDYDHLLDVARATWPERTTAMVFCDKDLNQMALIDLADSAKARNLSLTIVDLREEKDYARIVAGGLARNPGLLLILDDDALLGAKGRLTARLIYRATGRDLPVLGLAREDLKLGAVLVTGAGPGDPVYGNKALAQKLKLPLPAMAIDPTGK